jgi:hypothetical protein
LWRPDDEQTTTGCRRTCTPLSSGDGVYQRQAQLAEARAAPRYNAAEDEATCCARPARSGAMAVATSAYPT